MAGPTSSTTEPMAYLAPRATWLAAGATAHVAAGLGQFCAVSSGCVLVAADRVLAERGLLDGLLAGLDHRGLQALVVTDFGPELTDAQVDAAAETARESGAVAVIGLGGGSVLDAAKMIAVLVANDGRSSDWFGVTNPAGGRAGLVLVPTTTGTGAEVTRISMILEGGEKRIASSITMVPDLVVLDPELVAGLPPSVTASTALDALAHAAESFMSTASTMLTEADAIGAIQAITANLPAAHAGDAAARGHLLVAAYRAGLALNAGVVLGHSLGYAINHERPMAHGATTGLALAYTIAYNATALPDRKRRQLARALTAGRSDDLHTAAAAVKDLVALVEHPTSLDEAGIREGAEPAMARRTVDLYPRPTNPEPMDLPRVEALLRAMRTGDLAAAFTTSGKER